MPVPMISGPYRTFRAIKPGDSFIEYEGSTITIPITARLDDGAKGSRTETQIIQLTAFMRLEVFPAYINGLGTREFQFIIRDWELFGYSDLLNRLFFKDPLGRLQTPLPDRPSRRQMALMTFTISHDYVKFGDDGDSNLAPADQLLVDNITSHDPWNGNLFWQLTSGKNGKFSISFHNKPPAGGQAVLLNLSANPQDYDHLLAVKEDVAPGEQFAATIDPGTYGQFNLAFSKGNAPISKLIKPRQPVTIQWKLGTNPTPGAKGRVRIVTPPISMCTANQGPDLGRPIDSADFPARIMYAAKYHVFVNDTRFVEDKAGMAIADGVDQIPPRDVKVAFDKPNAGHLLGNYLEFASGDCTGMTEITEQDFRDGVAQARAARSTPLTPVGP